MIIRWDVNRSPNVSSAMMEIGDDDARMEIGNNNAGMERGDGGVVYAGMEIGTTMWFG